MGWTTCRGAATRGNMSTNVTCLYNECTKKKRWIKEKSERAQELERRREHQPKTPETEVEQQRGGLFCVKGGGGGGATKKNKNCFFCGAVYFTSSYLLFLHLAFFLSKPNEKWS